MTKKHFNALAAMFKRERPSENWDANKRVMWNALAQGVADECWAFNMRFDRARFIEACGGLFDMDRRAA